MTTLSTPPTRSGPRRQSPVVTHRAARPRWAVAVRRNWLATAAIVVLMVWTLAPFLWSVSAAFTPRLEIFTDPGLIPANPTIEAFRTVIEFDGFWRYLLNSAILAVTSTFFSVIVAAMAGYAFARYAFRMRHLLLALVLVPRLVPRVSLVIPLYQILERVGMLNTYTALIVIYTATAVPLATWIMAGFIRAVPVELEEAASIDGAGIVTRFVRIILPLSIPAIVTVAVLGFREAWNEFPFVLAFTSEQGMRTMSYQLFLLQDTLGVPDWPVIQAFSLMSILPVLLIYLRFEKKIVSGLMGGALK
ncbi:carbohydrate ABC transporter permease [Ruania rhizosphaerae]|uniref:carbohydrate ABC transporter permease n=1 Tax=Ruania rhizosphaerae TaxID=1840413 RepID=UPI00135836A7|nr:carbohydrate ABC transporter permease [Ruania rhizosphaerae]